jgi:UDP-N-acetylmuramoyl-tripeptide--D-alanyl-D-alanine ligase
MRAALKALKAMTHGGRRAWAVLGQMNELGEDSLAEHDAIGRLVVRLNVDRLVAVGEQAGPIHAGACLEGSWGEESTHVPDIAAAVAVLRAELRPGDVVLVKASRSAGLERIADALLDQDPHQQEHNDGTTPGATEGDAE